jgi:hypothetical protein
MRARFAGCHGGVTNGGARTFANVTRESIPGTTQLRKDPNVAATQKTSVQRETIDDELASLLTAGRARKLFVL